MKVYRRAEIETASCLISDVIDALNQLGYNSGKNAEVVSVNRNFGGVRTFDITVEWTEDSDQKAFGT